MRNEKEGCKRGVTAQRRGSTGQGAKTNGEPRGGGVGQATGSAQTGSSIRQLA